MTQVKSKILLLILTMLFFIHETSQWCFDKMLDAGTNEDINSLNFSPNDDYLVSTDDSGDVIFWDTATWTSVSSYDIGGTDAQSAVFSGDGMRIGVGFSNHNAHILNASNFAKWFEYTVTHTKTLDVDYNDDSSRFLTCGEINGARVWLTSNTGSYTYYSQMNSGDDVNSCVFDKFNRVIMTGKDHRMVVYTASVTPTQVINKDIGDDGKCVDVSPDGLFVITASKGNKAFITEISANNLIQV